MVDPTWTTLSVLCLVTGALVILVPKLIVLANDRLSKALVSLDDLLLNYRYAVGIALMVVGYLCFRLALLVPGVF